MRGFVGTVEEEDEDEEDEEADERRQPLSASPYHVLKGDDEVAFSVLVRMPSPPEDSRPGAGDVDMGGTTTTQHSQRSDPSTTRKANDTAPDGDEDAYPVLPDIMLGTTHVTPSEGLRDAGIKLDTPESLEESVISYVPPARTMVQRRGSSWAEMTWGLADGGPRL